MPREVDPLVYNMSSEDPGNISYAQIGGLSEQIRELREVSFLKQVLVNILWQVIKFVCNFVYEPVDLIKSCNIGN